MPNIGDVVVADSPPALRDFSEFLGAKSAEYVRTQGHTFRGLEVTYPARVEV
jgi:hypothetical protein